MIYTINVKDYDSMQNITVGLAKNGYYVTTNNVTDENYKSHWEIKYCESSEINKIPVNNGGDWDRDQISMEIHNKDNTKGVKCKIIPDEKPLVEKDKDKDKDKVDTNPYELMPRHRTPDVPPIPIGDKSDIITDESMTIITSVSGN